jgi:hypothetical protein
MARSTAILCLAVAAGLLLGQCYAAPVEVEGVQMDEKSGKKFIMHGTDKWAVVQKEGVDATMFLNEAKGEISYSDPRTRPFIPEMP